MGDALFIGYEPTERCQTATVEKAGDDLLSHAPAGAVSSAQMGLTAGFGMGPGGPPSRLSPAFATVAIGYVLLRDAKQNRHAKCASYTKRSGVSTARLNPLLSVHLRPI